MLDEIAYSDLVASVYDAALDPSLWPAVLAKTTSAIGANASGLFAGNPAERRFEMLPIGFDPRAVRAYSEHYARGDPLLPFLLARAPGRVLTMRMIMPAADWERTEIYADWARPNGVVESAAILAECSADFTVAFAIARARMGDEFGRDELDLLERLAPHIRRAMRVQRRLAAAWSRGEALDRLRDGVVLVDRDARVLLANRAAEALLETGAGLRTERGVLAAQRRAETAALRALIAGEGGSMALPRERGSPLGVVVVPMRSEASWLIREQPAAVVFIADADAEPMLTAERLQALFGLTPAQAALAREIARGDGLDAAAARLGVSRGTARTHLAAVLAKTGTKRQAELVRLLLRACPNLREP